MVLLKRFGWLIPLLFALPAFGAGGSCPSSSNYLTTSGTLTTLSALNISSCFYIAANGSDSNDGKSEASGHPWLHAPGMPSCTGNCATAYSGSLKGIGLILRGGDTWHFGNSGASPYTGGTWVTNQDAANATPTYVGVDQSWYSGSSWARPILTGDNPVNASQTLSSCTYNTAGLFDWSGGAYFTFDNFEMTGVCNNLSTNPIYVNYGSLSGWGNFYNLYIHGWSHVQFSNPNNCTATSICMIALNGSVQSGDMGNGGDTLLFNVVDGSDSDGPAMNCLYHGGWRVAYNYFDNCSQYIPSTDQTYHDNMMLNFVDNGHANVYESLGMVIGASNVVAIYDNVWGHLYSPNDGVVSDVCFWPNFPATATLMWFNNVMFDQGPCEWFNAGEQTHNEGTLNFFNNTVQMLHRTDGGTNNFGCSSSGFTINMVNANNHYITDDVSTIGGMYDSECHSPLQFTDTDSILMTNAVATTDGYTASQSYVYSPISNSSPTVGAGQNNTSTFCATLTTAAATDTYLSDAATKCQQSTGYACTYNATTHVNTCPALTPTARPSSGAWDQGAYEFNNSLVATPTFSPVAGTYSSTQSVTISSATSGATLCYTVDGSAPTGNGNGTCVHGTTYTTAVSIAVPTLLQAIGTISGGSDSAVGSAQYNIVGVGIGANIGLGTSVKWH